MRTATPDERPTVPSFETDEMPRIPIGTRPLRDPFKSRDGTSLLRSAMSPTFWLDTLSLQTTETAAGMSARRYGRFCAVTTISSNWGPASCGGGATVCAYEMEEASAELVKSNARVRVVICSVPL